jgi:hypothetical protein
MLSQLATQSFEGGSLTSPKGAHTPLGTPLVEMPLSDFLLLLLFFKILIFSKIKKILF